MRMGAIENQEFCIHVYSFYVDWLNDFPNYVFGFAVEAYQGDESSCDVVFLEPHFHVRIQESTFLKLPFSTRIHLVKQLAIERDITRASLCGSLC